MENNQDKIEHLKPIQSGLDFQAIYRLGRQLSAEKVDFGMRPLSEIEEQIRSEDVVSANVVREVKAFFVELATNVLDNQLQFPSIVIDFVLFDPADTTGSRFYIAICSVNQDIINLYKAQVDKNIKGDYEESRDDERRPILTNPHIYSSPYFYKGPDERKEDIYKKFAKIDANNIEVHFGSFYKRADNTLPLSQQARLIEEFFDLIQDELDVERKNGKDKYEFNTSILIPLMRPAASYSGDDRNRLNGGGVFIYGQTQNTGNDEGANYLAAETGTAGTPGYLVKKAARLKYFFERKILETSHSFVTFEKQKEIHNNLELNLFHHFGSNLRGLPNLLSLENLGADNLTEWQKNILSKTSEYLRNCIDNIYLVSNCYQEYILRKGSSTLNYSYVGDLVDELNAVAKKFKEQSDIQVITGPGLSDKSTSIIPKVLANIFEQFVYNALKEYNHKKIAPAKRKISIQLTDEIADSINEGSLRVLHIYMFNNHTSFTQVVLNNAGLKPIKSKTSSGLGLYFLNFSLHILGALESAVVNRYFEIENTKEPEGAAISFKFQYASHG